jgi:hypothetical protein
MFDSPLSNLDIARRTVIDRRAAADRDRLVRRALGRSPGITEPVRPAP